MNARAAHAYLESLQPTQVALGLDRVRGVLARLEHPERCAPALHVAGTNGKGSVCAMAERALRAAGLRTGFYSSPHLLAFEERIRIGGVPLRGEALARAVTRVQAAAHDLALTYFEFGTAVAFVAFREAKVDAQVLETGLGGRLDATNVVDQPIAAAITSLGLDHTRILGETLPEIAFEKAGILKPGLTCAVAALSPETAPVLEGRAQAIGAELWIEGRDFALEGDTYRGPSLTLPDVEIGLRGPHQRQNGAVALALLEIASQRLSLPAAALRTGLAQARWPGRLQLVRPVGTKPGVEVALDGAHNPAAAVALAHAVRTLWPGRTVSMVFGLLDDKDAGPMLHALCPLAHRVLLTTPHTPRARAPSSYAAQVAALVPAVEIQPDVAGALKAALASAQPGELVLVCGSLYVVAEALAALGEHG